MNLHLKADSLPDATTSSGQVGGLQCDVWRSAALPPGPGGYHALPLGAVAVGSPTFKIRTDSGSWHFSLQAGGVACLCLG